MSSIRGYGNCDSVWLASRSNDSAFDRLPVTFGGTSFNDSVKWLNVRHCGEQASC